MFLYLRIPGTRPLGIRLSATLLSHALDVDKVTEGEYLSGDHAYE
jgi:hypothetical protein